MYTKLLSLCHQGLKVHSVEVEVDTGRGLPGMVIVGLPDKAIMESKDRVKAALSHAKMPVPRSRVTVNLAPGDLKKEGSLYDLPIALGVMICTEFLKPKVALHHFRIVGELSLNGQLRGVRGILNFALHAKNESKSLIIPAENYHEANYVEDVDLIPISDLNDLLAFFNGDLDAVALRTRIKNAPSEPIVKHKFQKDFSEVKGQSSAKRAMTIAAAGGHNLLLIGPPGSGKSMLSERFPSILSPMDRDEALDVTRIYSISGLLNPSQPVITDRPFRAPHHTISEIALIGGGSDSKPGEISLSHRGVLFMDEFPEFKRNTLEVLRQPMESGRVSIGRAKQVCDYPCQFTLIAAMNPCPCGYLGSRVRTCRCSSSQIEKYLSKLSGPLLDRIDLHIEVSDQNPKFLRQNQSPALSSGEIREQALIATKLQKIRYEQTPFKRNGELKGAAVEKFCPLEKDAEQLLLKGMEQLGLSNRAFHKVLLIARTIADLEQQDTVKINHISEAITYRVLDQKIFK